MTVYVDSTFTMTPQGDTPLAQQARRNGNRWCHMWADTRQELDAMADKLGLRRSWVQLDTKPYMIHYDLVPSKRALAVKAGAVEIKAIEYMRMKIAGSQLAPDPESLAASLYGVELDG
jgi:hypothetical protein